MVVLFRDTLSGDQRASFDDWYASGSDDDFDAWFAAVQHSPALGEAATRMNAMMTRAEDFSKTLPSELTAVITPIQQLLQQVCVKSVASLNQA